MPVGLCLTAFLQNHTPPQPCDVLRPSRSSNNTPTHWALQVESTSHGEQRE